MKSIFGLSNGFFSLAVSFVAVTFLGTSAGWAQQPLGFARTILQRADVSAPGFETVQITAEFPAGVGTGRHSHPGEEVGYVLEGPFVVTIEGKPPMTLKTGDHFFVPANTVHDNKNMGTGKAKVLITYIVEKGKPLSTPAK